MALLKAILSYKTCSLLAELQANFGSHGDAGVPGLHGHGGQSADLPVPRGTPSLRVVQRPPSRLPAVRPRPHERAQQDR